MSNNSWQLIGLLTEISECHYLTETGDDNLVEHYRLDMGNEIIMQDFSLWISWSCLGKPMVTFPSLFHCCTWVGGTHRQKTSGGHNTACHGGNHCVGKILLHLWLKVKMFVGQPEPDRFNRRYYPERRDISDIGYRAKQKLQEGVNDLALLETLVKMLRDDVYRAHDDNQLLMLILQTEWQRHHLSRYGNAMVFVDRTYKTTCYTVPLYQLTVTTNVGYIHVASLIMQCEDTESIREVLHVVANHNTSWSPRIIMIDADEKEESAENSVFPGNQVYWFFMVNYIILYRYYCESIQYIFLWWWELAFSFMAWFEHQLLNMN